MTTAAIPATDTVNRLRTLRAEVAEAERHLRHWLTGPCLPGCFSPYLQALSDRVERQRAEIRTLVNETPRRLAAGAATVATPVECRFDPNAPQRGMSTPFGSMTSLERASGAGIGGGQ